MYKIKQIPEDFLVKEINNLRLEGNGQYSYFVLKKKSYNTLRAIEKIANELRIDRKSIGFSGNKDKNAVTEQIISIKGLSKNVKNLNLKDIDLRFIGKSSKEVFLSSHVGNEFEITIRNLTADEIGRIGRKIEKGAILMPNYFGQQRFSKNNAEIGRSIVKKDFKTAIALILKQNSDYNGQITEHIKKSPNDFVVALKIIPQKLLRLYVHAYQSYLFNKALEQYLDFNKTIPKKFTGSQIKNKHSGKNFPDSKSRNSKNNGYNKNKGSGNPEISGSIIKKIPVIGFGTEIASKETAKIIDKIMKEENIWFRDFIIRQIPELSSEGDERDAFIKITDFKIAKKGKDELNKNKEKIVVKFSLPKGCYATVLVDQLLG